MRTFDEWCVFFQDINNDPAAITPRLTVRDLMAAKDHIHNCKVCMAIVDKVLGDAPVRSVIDDANPN
jgi:hypothetical protein